MSKAKHLLDLIEKIVGCKQFHISAAERKAVEAILKKSGVKYDFGASEKTRGYIVEICYSAPEEYSEILTKLKKAGMHITQD